MVMDTLQIRLTRDMINELKTLVGYGLYPSISEAVRDSVRRLITGKEGPIKVPEQQEKAEEIKQKLDKEIKKQFQKPKGTVDFFPEEMAVRNYIFSRLRETANRYNYKEIEAPAFESMDLLTAKQGEEIKEQIFVLEKKGDEEFGLRFDITVSATRMFIEKQKSLPKPVKWFYITRMWRYEKPQAGRLREFFQFGTELFGSDKPEADAETISLVIDSLLNLGLKKDDFIVRINNKKLLEGLLLEVIEQEKIPGLMRIIDKKSKITEEEFAKELDGIGIDEDGIRRLDYVLNVKDVSALKKRKLNELAKQGLNELMPVLELLKNKKEFLKLDLSTARGLAYYTGIVFECFDAEEKFRAIAGGGRYDNMVELFKGEKCAATGFGLGFATLSLLLKEKGLLPAIESGPDFYIAVLSDKIKENAFDICSKLRKKYNVEIDLSQRNLGNQLKYANAIGAKKVIFIGEDEIKNDMLSVKDMKTGKQEKVKLCDIVS